MNLLKSFALSLAALAMSAGVFAQAPQGYADQQSNSTAGLCIACGVDDPDNAADGNENTFSQLNIPLGLLQASIEQTLFFPFQGLVGDEIVLVLGTTDVLDVNALGNMKISTWITGGQNPDQFQVDLGSITGLGNNKFLVTFTTQFDFDAVQVLLESPVAGLSSNIQIYTAYVPRVVDAPETVCSLPESSANGTEGFCLNLLGVGCRVNSPNLAYDGDEGTFSELLIELLTLNGGPWQTFEWDDVACGVDSVNVIMSANDGNGGLIDLASLNINPSLPGNDDGAIEIAALDANGNIIPGTEQFVTTTSLQALGNASRYQYTYVPPAFVNEYYGVRVWYHGLTLLSGLNIHEVCMNRFQPPSPVTGGIVRVCYNTIQALTVDTVPNTTAYWYTTATPNDFVDDAVFVGNTYDPSSTNPGFTFTSDVTYYVYARNVDKDCFSTEFTTVEVIVYPELQDPSEITIQACYNEEARLIPQPFGELFNLYADADGDTIIQLNGTMFPVGPILNDTTFYIQTTDEVGCLSANIVPIHVELVDHQFLADVPDNINACIGDDVVITISNPIAGVQYNWYDAPQGGTLIAEDVTTYSITGLSANTIVYVDAVTAATGCEFTEYRKPISINAVAKPDLIFTNRDYLVCPGDTVNLIASSSAGDVLWYDAPTGGNLLFTGNSFNVTDNGGVQTFYAQATNDRCPSDSLYMFTVTSTTTLIGGITNMNSALCFGEGATISAPTTPGVTYSFWSELVGGVQIGTGSIDLSNLTQDTTFYVQIDQALCTDPANQRGEVTIRVTNRPDAATMVANTIYACLGDTVTFEIDNPNALFTYNWYDTDGNLVFTGTSYDVEILQDDTIFEVEVADGLCFQDDPRTVVRAIKAEDYVNPVVNGGATIEICKGDEVTLTATTTISNSGTKFHWYDAPNGGTLLATNAVYTVPGSATSNDLTVYVEAEYVNICGDGLSERVAVDINTKAPLATPTGLTCGTTTTSEITFDWNNVTGATGYIVNVNGGADIVITGNQPSKSEYQVTGLNPGENVTIMVRATGSLACQESASTSLTCVTNECPYTDGSDMVIINPTETICFLENGSHPTQTFNFDTNTLPAGTFTATVTNTNTGESEVLANAESVTISYNATSGARFYTEPGTYIYEVTITPDDINCTATSTRNFQLTVSPTPIVKFIAVANTPAVVGQFINEFTFNNLTAGTRVEYWDFGDGNTETVTYNNDTVNISPVSHTYLQESKPDEPYIVRLRVENEFGCIGEGVIEEPITVSTVPEVFVPNTFTPNGDGANDIFRVYGENIEVTKVRVYNIYGNEVYSGSGMVDADGNDRGWDGTFEGANQPSGVYAYIVEYKDFLGNVYNMEGNLTLIRK